MGPHKRALTPKEMVARTVAGKGGISLREFAACWSKAMGSTKGATDLAAELIRQFGPQLRLAAFPNPTEDLRRSALAKSSDA